MIIYEKRIQELCSRRYANHPKGCPNYDKKIGCPPNKPLINEILDFNKPAYIIYVEFDIAEHARNIKLKHPDWSERQVYCCLYWQPKARKILRGEEAKMINNKIEKIVTSPEAHGVNLDLLMRKIEIRLEWPPRQTARLISLGGYAIK